MCRLVFLSWLYSVCVFCFFLYLTVLIACMICFYYNVCDCHAFIKGNLLTYLLIHQHSSWGVVLCTFYQLYTEGCIQYCDEYVCLCVCCLLLGYFRKHAAELHEIVLHVDCGRGSVVFRRRCDTSCTSGFDDDVTFSHNRPYILASSESDSLTAETTASIPTKSCSAMKTPTSIYRVLHPGGEVCHLRLPSSKAYIPRKQLPRSILVTSSPTLSTRPASSRGCYEDVARVGGAGDSPVQLATRLPDRSAGGQLQCIVLPVCPCVVSFSKVHEPDTRDLLRTNR